jgi:hypothetical protein
LSATLRSFSGSKTFTAEIKSQDYDFVAPVQQNDFGILEVVENQAYPISMVVWLALESGNEAKECKHFLGFGRYDKKMIVVRFLSVCEQDPQADLFPMNLPGASPGVSR